MLPTGSKASSNTVLRYRLEDTHAAVEADSEEAGRGRLEFGTPGSITRRRTFWHRCAYKSF
jgi:hypothetical protein